MASDQAVSEGPVVEVLGLTRRYRRTVALDNATLTVPCGGVTGLVGENGAGKTTLIKHVLGLLRAQSGTVNVFGRDPVHHPEEVLRRIGYLSENRDLPAWMRVDELMRYTRAFYSKWDSDYAEKLRDMFELDPTAKIGTLSMGQTAKAGLLAALAHRPEFLVLDEPSSGLDPIVRRDILDAVVRTAADEGRTILFSSHLLDEVERVGDRVVMLHSGHVVLDDTMEAIKKSHRSVVVRSANGGAAPTLPGMLSSQQEDGVWKLLCNVPHDELAAAASQGGYEILESGPASLNDIFVARAGTPAHVEE